MQLINEQNAASYLHASGRIASEQEIVVRELPGGVSNVVLLVLRANGEPYFVLKQAREQLRVPEPWFSDVARVWREVEVLEIAQRIMDDDQPERASVRFPVEDHQPERASVRFPDGRGSVSDRLGGSVDVVAAGAANRFDDVRLAAVSASSPDESGGSSISVPRVLFVDRENYLFAMTAAPPHQPWKKLLLDGDCNAAIASACGRLLGLLHARTWNQPDVAHRIADRRFFEQLRIDPYYRHVARQQPTLAPVLEQLMESLARHPRCLVHGDFSPKNILVSDGGLTLVDFEVGHFGDPAFDIGFFLSHLVLKAFHFRPRWSEYIGLTIAFWADYEPLLQNVVGTHEFQLLVERGIRNFAGCLLARVDGKSKVEYLGPAAQDSVRRIASSLLLNPPATWQETLVRLT